MTTAGSRRAQPYVAAFDGLRAIAVIAVVAYHASLSQAPGGFFGVDVFFVISGYLVTSLLLDRAAMPGTSDLLDFWRRRLVRLVPAAATAIAATFVLFALLGIRSVGTLTAEAAGALGYVANWVFLLRDHSYFETAARPSPFLHFWSLAVEAQFYLVWPLLVAAALRAGGRLTLFLLAISLGSIAVVIGSSLYDPFGDPSRSYYGTDARASGLLIGAALGIVARPGLRSARRVLGGSLRPLVEVAGWAGLAVLAWLVTRGSEFSPFTYQGGFLVASVATVGVLVAGLHGRNSLSWALSIAPLRWIGLRSYSIYLWHWPVVVLTQPQMSSALQSWNLAVARFAATLILAEISYRLVEHRFRSTRSVAATDASEVWWRRYRPVRRAVRRLPPRLGLAVRSPWAPPASLVVAGLVAIVVAGGLPVRTGPGMAPVTVAGVAGYEFDGERIALEFRGAATAAASATPASAATAEPVPTLAPALPAVGLSPASAPVVTVAPASESTLSSSGAASSVSGLTDPASAAGFVLPDQGDLPDEAAALPDTISVTAIGDSVMVAAVPALAEALPGLYVDAEVGRQFWSAADLIHTLREAGDLGDVVVIHLGSNGPFTDDQFDALMEALDGVRGVVFVNVTVPRRWESDVNDALARRVQGLANVSLADWNAISRDAPDFFAADGVHLTTAGQTAYADLIGQHVLSALGLSSS
ncbi:MAG: hypothetical protein AMXMBFR23_03930 [Chloroflexota bacterium]